MKKLIRRIVNWAYGCDIAFEIWCIQTGRIRDKKKLIDAIFSNAINKEGNVELREIARWEAKQNEDDKKMNEL